MKNKKIAIIGITLLLFLKIVSAINVGISPATMKFENVMRNGYSEKTMVVSVDTTKEVKIELQPRGEISEWINYSSEKLTVSKEKPLSLLISVTPPPDTPNGNYTGFLRVMTSELGEGIEGHAVSVIRTSLDLSITVGVTDLEITECTAYEFKVESVEKGDDLVFRTQIHNRGNVRLKPKMLIDIWDRDQTEKLRSLEFSEKEILPTTKENFEARVSSKDLETGQYWADFFVLECYSKQTLTFDILEPGALKAEGILLNILNNKTSRVGDTVPIEVSFKNTGEKELEAYFKGTVTLENKIIDLLETDKINVPTNSIEYFSLFFTPQKEGRYIISGRVFYNNKKTFESSSILEAINPGFSFKRLFLPAAYITLIVLIGILYLKIRKERKSYSIKLKQLSK